MRNTNIVVGRLSRDPKVTVTKNGNKVAQFTLISERDYKKGKQREVDLIPCIAWRGTAELIERYLKKGMLIDIEGRLQSRTYQVNDQKKFVLEVIVANFHMLESKSVTEKRAAIQEQEPQDSLPLYEQENGAYDPYGFGEGIDISDDDLAF